MQERFNITLPLLLGANAIHKKMQDKSQTQEVVSTTEMECSIVMNTAPLLEVDHGDNCLVKGEVQKSTYCNNLLQVCVAPVVCSESQNKEESNDKEIDKNQGKLFPFELELRLNKNGLLASISKLMISFQLHHIPKPKFVKNDNLQNLNSPTKNSNQWGLLTMDQSQRIVIQGQTTSFPAIGFWSLKKEQNQLAFLRQLVDYCSMQLSRKCKFILGGKKYFYMAKCRDGKTPELFLVEWREAKEKLINLEYSYTQLKNKEQLILRSDEHSHLEFTLRSDEKLPSKLLNIDCSPVLFHDSPSTSISQEQPDSPRFRSQPTSSPLQLQCATLRRLVQMQQKQINQLRSQLMRVTSSLSANNRNPRLPLRQNKGKYLTQKDLSLSSPSDPPSTNSSSNEDWNAWDRFHIIDK